MTEAERENVDKTTMETETETEPEAVCMWVGAGLLTTC